MRGFIPTNTLRRKATGTTCSTSLLYKIPLLLFLFGCLACTGTYRTDSVTAIHIQKTADAPVSAAVGPKSPPATVEPAASRPPSASAISAAPFATSAITIQVGAFSTAERAKAYAKRLRQHGLDTYHVMDSDGLFKVRFQSSGTKKTALRRAEGFKADGVIENYFIVPPSPARKQTISGQTARDGIVETARRFIGAPYRLGAASVEDGFDCSGLTMTVYRINGLDLPRTAYGQYRIGTAVQRRHMKTGDLLFFDINRNGRADHVGIYCGGNRFIHASEKRKKVIFASLTNRYFDKHYLGARRYL